MKGINPLNTYNFDEDGLAIHTGARFNSVVAKLSQDRAIVYAVKVEQKIFSAMSPKQLERVIKLAQGELAKRQK